MGYIRGIGLLTSVFLAMALTIGAPVILSDRVNLAAMFFKHKETL